MPEQIASPFLGLLRSLLIYYGQPHKLLRMVAFYREFIRPGDLCFDIGAHVGNRLWAWRRLGASIVALEPQPDCIRVLEFLYGRSPAITLLEQAAGAAPGTQKLYVSRRTPTVSSLSSSWIAAAQKHPAFSGVQWDVEQVISVTTLDALVARHGQPAFCKIDVEGYELEVLKGLGKPLKALSFEFLPLARDLSLGCISRLEELGEYEYNWSEGESHRLESPAWLPAERLSIILEEMPLDHPGGDIYARLTLNSRV
jgi:FkbM family methyltransferase